MHWLNPALSYWFMCRASEIFAYSKKRIHTEFSSTRGDMAFFMGDNQLAISALWSCADRVEVLFEASKADHDGIGSVVSR